MKVKRTWLVLLLLAMILIGFFSCQKEETKIFESARLGCNLSCTDYEILQDQYVRPGADGAYNSYFEWRITNPCPGNGKNGTLQDLSHWSFTPGNCLVGNPEALLEAWVDTISGNGTAWVQVPVPLIAVDPSCSEVPVVKFNYGTKRNKTSYYRLVVRGAPNGFWVSGPTTVYFKSGVNTGCCSLQSNILGIGCIFYFPT
jgi:hypothetical protein